jgi:hypothetical protein
VFMCVIAAARSQGYAQHPLRGFRAATAVIREADAAAVRPPGETGRHECQLWNAAKRACRSWSASGRSIFSWSAGGVAGMQLGKLTPRVRCGSPPIAIHKSREAVARRLAEPSLSVTWQLAPGCMLRVGARHSIKPWCRRAGAAGS